MCDNVRDLINVSVWVFDVHALQKNTHWDFQLEDIKNIRTVFCISLEANLFTCSRSIIKLPYLGLCKHVKCLELMHSDQKLKLHVSKKY